MSELANNNSEPDARALCATLLADDDAEDWTNANAETLALRDEYRLALCRVDLLLAAKLADDIAAANLRHAAALRNYHRNREG